MTSEDHKSDELSRAMGRYADGDLESFKRVYNGMKPIVLGCLKRWTRDAALADDLTQETFIRVHKARHRYKRDTPVAPWVLTIARRLSIDALRKKSRSKEVLAKADKMPEGVTPSADEMGETEELIRDLREAISLLPESLRTVVALHKLDGKPLAEVAQILGINEGAARVRAHRGYKRLKERMLSLLKRQSEES